MTLTDTHAHIYLDEFSSDREDMLKRAREAGVARIYMPNIDVASIGDMMALEERHPDWCFAMMGLHPCSVKSDFEKQLYVMEAWLHKRKFAAIGEMGTDLYWDKTFWEQQKEAFGIQARWAKEFGLPMVIHCRQSIDETIALLSPLAGDGLTGIFHCFTGNGEQAVRVVELGFYLGIGGVATFKNGGLDRILPHIPSDRLVLETDSPYLAPVPHRGKRNEPAYLASIAQKVSEILGMTVQELARVTSENAALVFSGYRKDDKQRM